MDTTDLLAINNRFKTNLFPSLKLKNATKISLQNIR